MKAVERGFSNLLDQLRVGSESTSKPCLVQIGDATCERTAGADQVYQIFANLIKENKREDQIKLRRVGCTGCCSLEPIVTVLRPGEEGHVYCRVDQDVADKIFQDDLIEGRVVNEHLFPATQEKIDQKNQILEDYQSRFKALFGHLKFFAEQTRLTTRHVGIVDPESLKDFLEKDGMRAFLKTLTSLTPEVILNEVIKSKLRGRGGGGFLTGRKWSFMAPKVADAPRYLICNADEGDPGAFMDRGILESDPFTLIEGILIAGFTLQVTTCYIYIRAEYPLAVERVRKAIHQCRENGLLGENILGSEFSFDIQIKLGSGAYVCGEEIALIRSIEGRRGMPEPRPPFPAESGLWGAPTIINNVETLAAIPSIISLGGEFYSQLGTKESGGTKLFALTGEIKYPGLVEVPFGIPLMKIIEDIGGGLPDNKQIKSVQTGGPAGGFLPYGQLSEICVDYDSFSQAGSIIGSGGMIIISQQSCLVDLAKFYLRFSCLESCGKCTPCREGTYRLHEIMERIVSGKGESEDLRELKTLAIVVSKASLCGLGRSAPQPLLSLLNNFPEEFAEHLEDKFCSARTCSGLTKYQIDPAKCIGCGACKRVCPQKCITGEPKRPHLIDPKRCIACGACARACPVKAISKG